MVGKVQECRCKHVGPGPVTARCLVVRMSQKR